MFYVLIQLCIIEMFHIVNGSIKENPNKYLIKIYYLMFSVQICNILLKELSIASGPKNIYKTFFSIN